MKPKNVNVVIVGAGAGGGVAAKELATAGLSVVVLEGGPWYTSRDFQKDELQNARRPKFQSPYTADPHKSPRVLVHGDGSTSVGPYAWVAECVGGGTQTYGALAYRFLPQDFQMKSTYGHIEESAIEDWPFSYEDLAPFYQQAERELGVSGDYRNSIHPEEPGSTPMPPLAYNIAYDLLKPAADRLGWHAYDAPMLRNSVAYGGRPPCMRCRWCAGFICEVDAKAGTHNTLIPRALATGNCTLRSRSRATRILLDAKNRARGVEYLDDHERLVTQTADMVVMAGGAIETPRLLLNSKTAAFPNGLGNRHDWVGRCMQSHAYAGSSARFEADVYDDIGPGCSIAVSDFNHGNPGFISGGVIANDFQKYPVRYALEVPVDVPKWGKAHKDYMRGDYRKILTVKSPVQELPVFDMRVEVDPVVKDHWDVPVARLSGQRHVNDKNVGDFIAARCADWLREAGATEVWQGGGSSGISLGQHQAGTCRMGHDPMTSVVNEYGQVHDIDNLFLCDGSVHVTNGGFNPVLTIFAVSYRSCDYMKRQWRGGKIS